MKVEKSGRLSLPASVRKKLGIVEGETQVIMHLRDDGRVEIATRDQALAWVRAEVRKYIPAGVSLSDELIADRRAEAAKEDAS